MSTDDPIRLGPDLTLPAESVTSTFAILANRGAGKSATAHRFVEQLYHAGLPVVVVDVKGDWWGIRSSADGAGAGLPFVIFGGEHADVPLEAGAGEVIADVIATDQISAVLDLSHLSKTKARTFATTFAERLYLRNRDPLHVVVEEADVLVPQRATNATARLLGAWEDIAKRGRHRGLGLTVVSQRPQEVSKSVLDLMETVILLRMTGPRSIKAAQDWISVNAEADTTTATEVIASLPALDTGEGWVWSPALLHTLQRVRFSLFDTFDSHATPTPGRRRIVPKTRADIDLEALGAEIAATVERAKDNDPVALRAEIARLHRDLAAAGSGSASDERHLTAMAVELADKDRQLEAKDRQLSAKDVEIDRLRERITALEARPTLPAGLVDALDAAQRQLSAARDLVDTETTTAPVAGRSAPARGPHRPATTTAPDRTTAPSTVTTHAEPTSRPAPAAPAAPVEGTVPVSFRAGAERMLEALGRMAPLRLTRSQWGTVAKMKATGGTFSTYLGELRRAGLLDENTAGFTLTEAGFAHIGGQPAPMTAGELQAHYLSILRAGAARMLRTVIDTYPDTVTREQLGAAADITPTAGTFSTYLGELRRNGLVTVDKHHIRATDILMYGAHTNQTNQENLRR